MGHKTTRKKRSNIKSTRSDASEDARRDFDGFEVNEELRRFRKAVQLKQWSVAAKLADNLDEHMSRGGDLPKEWLGPPCMQTLNDFKIRLGLKIPARRGTHRRGTHLHLPRTSN